MLAIMQGNDGKIEVLGEIHIDTSDHSYALLRINDDQCIQVPVVELIDNDQEIKKQDVLLFSSYNDYIAVIRSERY